MTQKVNQFRNILTWVSIIAGLVFFIWLVKSIDLTPLRDVLQSSTPTIIAIGLLHGLFHIFFTIGWVFPLAPLRLSFLKLFGIFLAGNVANYAVQLSGEPLRARLLKPHYTFSEGLYSVSVAKYCELIAQSVLYMIGLPLVLLHFDLPDVVKGLVVALFTGFFSFILFLFWWQKGGFFRILYRFTSQRITEKLTNIDGLISKFYNSNPKGFFLTVFFKFLGKLGGVVEVLLVLNLLGYSPTLIDAFAIETMILITNDFLFFLPGRVGGAEGVRILVFLLIGYPASEGLVYAIIRRIREVIWVGAGVATILVHKMRGEQNAKPKT